MQRYAGVLLAVSSLPSKYGIGCFDKAAYAFVDWLEKAGQKYWQILPLGPTCWGICDDSPYQATSAFAGNPYFISLEALMEEGVLTEEECDAIDFGQDPGRVDFDRLHNHRLPLLRKAYERSNVAQKPAYQKFLAENAWWLDDYALFMALRSFFGDKSWTQWPEDIRRHWGFAVDYYNEKLYFDIEFQKYMQFKFYEQWSALKAYANKKNIQIVGDIPIYVSPDGADLWAHPELFQLDENDLPTQVAGCPPDVFEAEGQLWGNPLYNWEHHRNTGYGWWISRLRQNFRLYDVVRIDHFRGFDEYYAIPAGAKNALGGHWEKGPGMELFDRMKEALGECRVIAEDLGLITESVRQLVKDSGYPNMKVLQFAFDEGDEGAANDHLPHNHQPNCVVYTGTHDNETIAGWVQNLTPGLRKRICEYLDVSTRSNDRLWQAFLVQAMRSCAGTCVIPMQDLLGLDNSCRMNQPATVGANWRWRMLPGAATDKLAREHLALTKRYGRVNWDNLKPKTEETAASAEKEA